MKISYLPRWHPTDGTVYRQTFRITEEENAQLFSGAFRPGMNYGNAYTGSHIASVICKVPGYEKQLKRIIVANSAVFVGDGQIPY